jgi:ABC-type dipeptide/oligopeptide/nickel transport system permease component
MAAYLIRRVLVAIPTLFAMILVTFLMSYYGPGDPAMAILGPKATPEAIEKFRQDWGLDDPVAVQFFRYTKNALKGDFGISYKFRRPVMDRLEREIPVSAKIGILAVIVTVMISIPLGILAAVQRGTWIDQSITVLVLLFISVPNFVMAFWFMWVFSLKLGWLPVGGWGRPEHYVLPVLILGTRPAAFITRLTRSAMLDVIKQDYIRTANAKGLARKVVLAKHALRNALIPVITVLGGLFGALLTGSFFIERIFGIPGMGRTSVQAIFERDYPTTMATVLIFGLVFIVMNLVVDIVYTVIDPRIKYS